MRILAVSMSVSLVGLAASPAFAQTTMDYPTGSIVTYQHETGAQDNPTAEFQVVASHLVRLEGSVSMRLYYSDWYLAEGSFVRVTSIFDGDEQELDAEELADWHGTSAYFNGDSVLFELVAGPHTTGSFVKIRQVGITMADAITGSPGQCGICGSDDRTQSNLDFSGRLMPVGCTASIYTTNSCALTAGHCVDGAGSLVLQFRVPNSLANCATVNPPATHQYSILQRTFLNGGVGADWCVMTVAASQGLKPYQRYGTLRRIGTTGVASATAIYGFGVDDTCFRSQTQQYSPGNFAGQTPTYWTYTNDIRGGNSGSGLLSKDLIYGICTHCTVGSCSNIATKTVVAAFANARTVLCPPCVADLDANGSIGQDDLGLLLSGFGKCYTDVGFIHATDLDGNGCCDQGDLGIMLGVFGQNCP